MVVPVSDEASCHLTITTTSTSTTTITTTTNTTNIVNTYASALTSAAQFPQIKMRPFCSSTVLALNYIFLEIWTNRLAYMHEVRDMFLWVGCSLTETDIHKPVLRIHFTWGSMPMSKCTRIHAWSQDYLLSNGLLFHNDVYSWPFTAHISYSGFAQSAVWCLSTFV